MNKPFPPSNRFNGIFHVFKVQVIAIVLVKHWWEDLKENLFAPDHEINWHNMQVEDDVVGEEHVDQDIDELVLLIGLGWLPVDLEKPVEDDEHIHSHV